MKDDLSKRLSSFQMKRILAIAVVAVLLGGLAGGVFVWSSRVRARAEVSELIARLEAPDYETRMAALNALGKLGPQARPSVPATVFADGSCTRFGSDWAGSNDGRAGVD